MSPPSAPGPGEPRALSARERAILAAIEHDLDASAPALARKMTRLKTRRGPATSRLAERGLLAAALLVVLTAAGLVPAAVWPVLAVLGSLVLVPWAMLRAFERFERDGGAGGDDTGPLPLP